MSSTAPGSHLKFHWVYNFLLSADKFPAILSMKLVVSNPSSQNDTAPPFQDITKGLHHTQWKAPITKLNSSGPPQRSLFQLPQDDLPLFSPKLADRHFWILELLKSFLFRDTFICGMFKIQWLLRKGTYIWKNNGMFIQPCNRYFDSCTEILSSLPICVRSPNPSHHFWYADPPFGQLENVSRKFISISNGDWSLTNFFSQGHFQGSPLKNFNQEA